MTYSYFELLTFFSLTLVNIFSPYQKETLHVNPTELQRKPTMK